MDEKILKLKVQAEGRGLERMARQVALRDQNHGRLKIWLMNGVIAVTWEGQAVFEVVDGEVTKYEPGDEWESELERLYYEGMPN